MFYHLLFIAKIIHAYWLNLVKYRNYKEEKENCTHSPLRGNYF